MFPRIFDRYLGRQVGSATLIGVALLSGVMVLGNIYKQMNELLGNTELPLSTVLEFFALVIPFSLIYTIPWSFLTSILLVFGRLSADNELVSLRMTGQSMGRICLPVFALGIFFSAICLWVNVSLAPSAKDRMKRLFYQVALKNPETLFQEGAVVDRVPDHRIYVGHRRGKDLTDLFIIKISSSGRPHTFIRAKKAQLLTKPNSLDLTMLLEDVNIEYVSPESPEDPPRPLKMDSFPLEISLSEMQSEVMLVNASMKSTAALTEEAFSWRDSSTGQPMDKVQRSVSLTELNKRYSFSMACFTFALVGIPLGVTAQRRETSSGFVLSLATATVYLVFIILADTLNDKPTALPHLVMWAPNVLFLGLGGWLFYKLSKK